MAATFIVQRAKAPFCNEDTSVWHRDYCVYYGAPTHMWIEKSVYIVDN